MTSLAQSHDALHKRKMTKMLKDSLALPPQEDSYSQLVIFIHSSGNPRTEK